MTDWTDETRAAMESNLALPLHEHATDVTRLITESAYGNGTLSVVGIWDIASLTPDKLEQLRARGEREFVYAHAFDALLTNQPEWAQAFGGLTVNDITQHVKMRTAELIEERYQRSRAESALADRDATIARLRDELVKEELLHDEQLRRALTATDAEIARLREFLISEQARYQAVIDAGTVPVTFLHRIRGKRDMCGEALAQLPLTPAKEADRE